MIKKFASGATVASLLIFVAILILRLNSGFSLQSSFQLSTVWCFLPFIWGIWAALMPKLWSTDQLPKWGAILGLIVGIIAVFLLNLPDLFLDNPASLSIKFVLVFIPILVYYVLWLLVRWIYDSIAEKK